VIAKHGVGQKFIDALHSQPGARSIASYPVTYLASNDFAPSANAGAVNANAHVESMAASL
jgi:cutinase-like protein